MPPAPMRHLVGTAPLRVLARTTLMRAVVVAPMLTLRPLRAALAAAGGFRCHRLRGLPVQAQPILISTQLLGFTRAAAASRRQALTVPH